MDSIEDAIAVIDQTGEIRCVNKPWRDFGSANGACGEPATSNNYLVACDAAAMRGDEDARQVAIGLRALINGDIGRFQFEYPCHSPDEQRWFILNATKLRGSIAPQVVVIHKNITDRKLAELQVQRLSQSDSLTQLANRRHFDSFLQREWRARWRDQGPLSLLILDVDHFKLYNDLYGHPAGDACLKQIAAAIAEHGSRANDLAARYGGEEFALILGDSDLSSGKRVAKKILAAIRGLELPHENAPHSDVVTVSIGVCSLTPDQSIDEGCLIKGADEALYRAKAQGRNCVVTAGDRVERLNITAAG